MEKHLSSSQSALSAQVYLFHHRTYLSLAVPSVASYQMSRTESNELHLLTRH